MTDNVAGTANTGIGGTPWAITTPELVNDWRQIVRDPFTDTIPYDPNGARPVRTPFPITTTTTTAGPPGGVAAGTAFTPKYSAITVSHGNPAMIETIRAEPDEYLTISCLVSTVRVFVHKNGNKYEIAYFNYLNSYRLVTI